MTTWTDNSIETAPGVRVPVRVYGKRLAHGAAPVVLHFHGGAFTGGSLETGHSVSTLLMQAGAVVVSAGYPLAPAHRFPEAAEVAFSLLTAMQSCCAQWASRRSAIFVAGEEAGGNLAAGVALMARDRQAQITGQILISPMLDPAMGTCSIRSADAGPVGCQWADGWHAYLGSPEKAAHPYAAPLSATRLAGVAPALVLSAEDDPMRDESETYAWRLREAGVAVQHDVLPGPTGWPGALALPMDDAALAAAPWAIALRAQVVTFLAACAASRHPASPLDHVPA